MYLNDIRNKIENITPDNHVTKTKEILHDILDKLEELDENKVIIDMNED